MIKQLWLLHLDWDESLPQHILNQWQQFCKQLTHLNDLAIPRPVLTSNFLKVEFHGFCDASELAFGACIYVRSMNSSGHIDVKLLCSKSKVAPPGGTTIPRLELCAAVLLVKLMKRVHAALQIDSEILYWCDSTVVLHWINMIPSSLKTYVSNRVFIVQSLSNSNQWHYVRSGDNPADLVSRGIQPSKMNDCPLWFNGPTWLSNSEISFEQPEFCENPPETRTATMASTASVSLLNRDPDSIFTRFSNLRKLQKVFAFILRFIRRSPQPTPNLDYKELQESLTALVKLSQMESFPVEYALLKQGKHISKKSRLYSLNPFIHSDGTIRLGGRLGNSGFDYNKRHPCILDNKHPLTKLIFIREHIRLLHAGPQQVLYSVRQRFWPLTGRNLSRLVVHECKICFRAKPRHHQVIMGQLPTDRVTPYPPFTVTGVDYAGPFIIKDRKGRGCKHIKCYLSIFVCFSTKCVHLELVTALSTDAFKLTFKRFVARRGCPVKMFSDNGTNFVGANNELRELGLFLKQNQDNLKFVFDNAVPEWEFIPAYSPHFGGLWEAGVKSAKHHLRRVARGLILTYEELYTLIVEIESVMNSRPISPLSSDPTDFDPLTPAHFLIGRPLTSIPERDLADIPQNRLKSYQQIEQMRQNFWRRWNKEYVSELQVRSKWKDNNYNLKTGDMVVIKDDNLPPHSWHLGRIEEVFPGKDNVTRVASIRTNTGKIIRAISKICPLPSEDRPLS